MLKKHLWTLRTPKKIYDTKIFSDLEKFGKFVFSLGKFLSALRGNDYLISAWECRTVDSEGHWTRVGWKDGVDTNEGRSVGHGTTSKKYHTRTRWTES